MFWKKVRKGGARASLFLETLYLASSCDDTSNYSVRLPRILGRTRQETLKLSGILLAKPFSDMLHNRLGEFYITGSDRRNDLGFPGFQPVRNLHRALRPQITLDLPESGQTLRPTKRATKCNYPSTKLASYHCRFLFARPASDRASKSGLTGFDRCDFHNRDP